MIILSSRNISESDFWGAERETKYRYLFPSEEDTCEDARHPSIQITGSANRTIRPIRRLLIVTVAHRFFRILFCCSDKITKQGMRIDCPGFQLRMELAGDEPRMIGKLDDFDERIVRRDTAEHHSAIGQFLPEPVV